MSDKNPAFKKADYDNDKADKKRKKDKEDKAKKDHQKDQDRDKDDNKSLAKRVKYLEEFLDIR